MDRPNKSPGQSWASPGQPPVGVTQKDGKAKIHQHRRTHVKRHTHRFFCITSKDLGHLEKLVMPMGDLWMRSKLLETSMYPTPDVQVDQEVPYERHWDTFKQCLVQPQESKTSKVKMLRVQIPAVQGSKPSRSGRVQ